MNSREKDICFVAYFWCNVFSNSWSNQIHGWSVFVVQIRVAKFRPLGETTQNSPFHRVNIKAM